MRTCVKREGFAPSTDLNVSPGNALTLPHPRLHSPPPPTPTQSEIMVPRFQSSQSKIDT